MALYGPTNLYNVGEKESYQKPKKSIWDNHECLQHMETASY